MKDKDWKIELNDFGYYEAYNDNKEFYLYAKTVEELKIEIDENSN